ncbi:hypothetical protein M9H77_29927 [Catharanthus roseus]|uniref:Uncharacterized protein n=1 Tax=Catharanthus roseus TaxID=4058 RepID=A0ACB9ZWV2_CATRO|nr:hypothetical protein M9H77_29927 [Catharanthus roseus]
MTLVHQGLPPSPPIPFTAHPPPTTSYHPYTPIPYDPYGYSQPPQTSYDPYAHAPSLPIRAKFFEQLAGSVPIDSSYSGAEYGATARGISSSDVGDDDGDDHEPVPVVEASFSGRRPTPGKGTGFIGSLISRVLLPTLRRGRNQRMTVGSRQVQLMAVHRIQSLSLRIAVMSLVVYGVVR